MNAHSAPSPSKATSRPFHLVRAVLVSAAVTVVSAISVSSAEDPTSAGVTVRVRDRGGRAVPSARILRRTGDDVWVDVGTTGRDGTAVLADATTDGSWIVGAWTGRGEPSKYESPRPVPASSSRVDLTLDYGTIVRLDVVDAETGAAVQGVDWCLSEEDQKAGDWTASGGSRWTGIGEDGYYANQLSVRLVSELRDRFWVSSTGRPRLDSAMGFINSSALEQRIVLPLRRKALLDIKLGSPEGDYVPARRMVWRFDDGKSLPEDNWFPRDWDPPSARREIPFYRGGRVYLVADGDERRFSWTRLVTLPQAPPVEPIPVSIDPGDDLAWSGPRHGGLIGYGGGPLPAQGSTLRVTMVRFGGGRAANCLATVRSDGFRAGLLKPDGRGAPSIEREVRTDAAGVLQVSRLPKGGYVVSSRGHGFVAASTYVVVDGSDTVTEVELREPRGVTIDVVVVDASGKPLAFAAVEVHGPAGGRGDVGVVPHRIDPYVDRVGRRRFLRVDPGVVTVRAEWGAWKMSTNVYVEDGGQAEARLVYDPPNR